jgi:hypothetical protein
MRVSISAIDSTVVMDGKSGTVDCAGLLRDGVSAVQWFDDKGHIEHLGHLKPNKEFDDFTPFQPYLDAAEFPEPAKVEEPPKPPEPKKPLTGIGIAPIDAKLFNYENRLRALEGKRALSEKEFMSAYLAAIDDYIKAAERARNR